MYITKSAKIKKHKTGKWPKMPALKNKQNLFITKKNILKLALVNQFKQISQLLEHHMCTNSQRDIFYPFNQ